jgi:hypothetical protein
MSFTAENLYLQVKPSIVYALMVILVHLLAGIAIHLNSSFDIWLQNALFVCVLVSLFEMMNRRVLLMHPDSVTEVACHRGQWRLTTRSGDHQQAALREPLYAGQYLIVLQFRTAEKRKIPVVIARDACTPDTFRRTRISLRLTGLQP